MEDVNNFTTVPYWITPFDSERENIKRTSELLWQIIGTALLVIGLVGHTLSILTTSASSTLRPHSSGVFIISLSIVGLLTLSSGLLRQVVRAFSPTGFDVRSISDSGCKIHLFVTYLSLQLFAWLQATIALDRFVAVCLAQHYKVFSRWQIGLIIMGIEVVVFTALNSGNLVTGGLTIYEPRICFHGSAVFSDIWPYFDLLSFSILPAIVIIIFNALILYTLASKKNSKLKRHVRSLTIMLMMVNLTFLLSTVPISIVQIMDLSKPITNSPQGELAFACTSILQYAGTASTFFIYCLTGTRFKSELKRLFSRASTKRRSSDLTNDSQHVPTEESNI